MIKKVNVKQIAEQDIHYLSEFSYDMRLKESD